MNHRKLSTSSQIPIFVRFIFLGSFLGGPPCHRNPGCLPQKNFFKTSRFRPTPSSQISWDPSPRFFFSKRPIFDRPPRQTISGILGIRKKIFFQNLPFSTDPLVTNSAPWTWSRGKLRRLYRNLPRQGPSRVGDGRSVDSPSSPRSPLQWV